MRRHTRRSLLKGAAGGAAHWAAGGFLTPAAACGQSIETAAKDAAAGSPASSPSLEGSEHVPVPQPSPPSAWRKQGVVLAPTEPWEGHHIQNFTSPAEPLEGGRWRLWYSAVYASEAFTLAYAEGIPGEPMRKVPAQCSPGQPPDAEFALGGLPGNWRPVQPTHIRLGNGRHRLYFWAHGPGVLRYLAAESDDGRRYRVLDPLRPVLYHPWDRAAAGVPTPDGTVLFTGRTNRPPEEPAAVPGLLVNDAVTTHMLADGSFEIYAATLVKVSGDDPAYVAHDNAPGLLRVVDRLESGDGLRFERRSRVIQRDAEDPVDQQFYCLSSTRTERGCVGMLGHYRVRAQTMDLEWCWSADGRVWHRPQRRAWLSRGQPGEPDSYGIYPPQKLVRSGGRWHLFYTGVNTAHNGKDSHGPPRTVVMYATADSIWG